MLTVGQSLNLLAIINNVFKFTSGSHIQTIHAS